MSKKTKCLCAAFCVILLCIVFPLTAQAATTKSKAISAYKKFLTQKTITWQPDGQKITTAKCKFAIAYVDNNSVPELIIMPSGSNHVSGFFAMYTYVNGKVKHVDTMRDGTAYYKKKGIFTSYTALHGEYESFKKLSKGKASTLLRTETYFTKKCYDCSGKTEKTISESQFKAKLKKLVGTTKATQPKYYANTSANRAKYIK